MRIDIPEIEKVLPHRPPFLLIDRIIELEPMKYAVGIKNISINEDQFRGHFPGASNYARRANFRSNGTSWWFCFIISSRKPR